MEDETFLPEQPGLLLLELTAGPDAPAASFMALLCLHTLIK